MGDTRSITFRIVNSTELTLQFSQQNLNYGTWKIHPPNEIKPNQTTKPFEAIAGLAEAGVDGSIIYTSEIDPPFTLFFSNPNSGLNKYSYTGPANYVVNHSTGAGEVADVTYTIESDPTSG